MTVDMFTLPSSDETGIIGIKHLKRYWAKSIAVRNGLLPADELQAEWNKDNFLLNILGLGLEQTIKELYFGQPGFEEFEKWVLEINQGVIAAEKINQFNASFISEQLAFAGGTNDEAILTLADLWHWDNYGYVIIRDAVSREDCSITIQLICEFLQIDKDEPATWYNPHPAKEGIMIQLFQHPVLERNRHASKIRRAYEQLWGRKDLIVNIDKTGFNPPENDRWKFQASPLHWDVSLKQPIPFGTQGILYLTDTAENQGAFTVVPGFHQKISEWMNRLPPGSNPRTENLYELGPIPVAANAGDFIIWHHALPHAGSPNTATRPRFVQYINYAPVDAELQEEWI